MTTPVVRGSAALLSLITLVWATGCADDPTPASTPPSSAAPSTAPATTAPPAPVPPTTPPPTAATAPPTTEPDVEQAVIDAYLAAWTAYHEAAAAPNDASLMAAIERTTTGPNLELARTNLRVLSDNGWIAVQNETSPAFTTVESYEGLVEGRTDLAELIVCERNNEVVVEPGAAPDGSEAVINDDIAARRFRVRLQLEDGLWKSRSGEEIGAWLGATDCP